MDEFKEAFFRSDKVVLDKPNDSPSCRLTADGARGMAHKLTEDEYVDAILLAIEGYARIGGFGFASPAGVIPDNVLIQLSLLGYKISIEKEYVSIEWR